MNRVTRALTRAGAASVVVGMALAGCGPDANDVPVADDDFSIAAAVADVLRLGPQNYAGKNAVLFAQSGPPQNRHMIAEPRSAANAGLRANHAVGTDLHPFSQFGSRVNNRGGMEEGHE